MNKRVFCKNDSPINECKSNDTHFNEDNVVTLTNQKPKSKIFIKNPETYEILVENIVSDGNNDIAIRDRGPSPEKKKKVIYRSEKVKEEMKKAAQLNAQVKVNVKVLNESQINSNLVSNDESPKNCQIEQASWVGRFSPDSTCHSSGRNTHNLKNSPIPELSSKRDPAFSHRHEPNTNESGGCGSVFSNFYKSLISENKFVDKSYDFCDSEKIKCNDRTLHSRSKEDLQHAARLKSLKDCTQSEKTEESLGSVGSVNSTVESAKFYECRNVEILRKNTLYVNDTATNNIYNNKGIIALGKKDFVKSKKYNKTSESYRQIIRKLRLNKLHKSKKESKKHNTDALTLRVEKNYSIQKRLPLDIDTEIKLTVKSVKAIEEKEDKYSDIRSFNSWKNIIASSENGTIRSDQFLSSELSPQCQLKSKRKKSVSSYKSPEYSRSKDGGYDSDKTDICDYNDENNSKNEELQTHSFNDLKKLNCLAALNLIPSQDAPVAKLVLQDVQCKLLNSYKSILTTNKWNIFDENLKVYGLNEYDQYCKNDYYVTDGLQINENENLKKQKASNTHDDNESNNTRWLRQRKAYYKFYETDEIEQYQKYSMLKMKKLKAEKKLQGHDNPDKNCDRETLKQNLQGIEMQTTADNDNLTNDKLIINIIPTHNIDLDDDEFEGNLVMDEKLSESNLDGVGSTSNQDKPKMLLAKKMKRKPDHNKDEKVKIKNRKKKNLKKNDGEDNETTSNETNDDAPLKNENKSESFILSRELGPNFNWLENKIQKNYITDEVQSEVNHIDEKITKMRKKKKLLNENHSKHEKCDSSENHMNILASDSTKTNSNKNTQEESEKLNLNNVNESVFNIDDSKEIDDNVDKKKSIDEFDNQSATIQTISNTFINPDNSFLQTSKLNKIKSPFVRNVVSETNRKQDNNDRFIAETGCTSSTIKTNTSILPAMKYNNEMDQMTLREYKKKLEAYTRLKQMSEEKMQEIRNLEFEKEKVKIELWNLYNIQLRTSEIESRINIPYVNKNESYSSYIPIPSPPLNLEFSNVKTSEHLSSINVSSINSDSFDDKDSSVKPYVICGPAMPLQKLLSYDMNHQQSLQQQQLSQFTNPQMELLMPQPLYSSQPKAPRQNASTKLQYSGSLGGKNQLRSPLHHTDKQWKQMNATHSLNMPERSSVDHISKSNSTYDQNSFQDSNHLHGISSGMFEDQVGFQQFSPRNLPQKMINIIKSKMPEHIGLHQHESHQQHFKQLNQNIQSIQQKKYTYECHSQQPQMHKQHDMTIEKKSNQTHSSLKCIDQSSNNVALINDPLNMCYTAHNEFLEQAINFPPRYNSPQILLHHLPSISSSSKSNEACRSSPIKNVDVLMKTIEPRLNIQVMLNKVEIDEPEPIDVKPVLDLSNKSNTPSISDSSAKNDSEESTKKCSVADHNYDNNEMNEAKVLDLSKESCLTPLNLTVNNTNIQTLSFSGYKTPDLNVNLENEKTSSNNIVPSQSVRNENEKAKVRETITKHSINPIALSSASIVKLTNAKQLLKRSKSCESFKVNSDAFDPILERQLSTLPKMTTPSTFQTTACPSTFSPPPLVKTTQLITSTKLSFGSREDGGEPSKLETNNETRVSNVSTSSTMASSTACIYQTICKVVDAERGNDLLDLCVKDPLSSSPAAFPVSKESILKLFDSSTSLPTVESNKIIPAKISQTLSNTTTSIITNVISDTITKLTASKPIIDLTLDLNTVSSINIMNKLTSTQAMTYVNQQMSNQNISKSFPLPATNTHITTDSVLTDNGNNNYNIGQHHQPKSRNDSSNTSTEPKDKLQELISPTKHVKQQHLSSQHLLQQNQMLRLVSPQQLQQSSSFSNPSFTEILQHQPLTQYVQQQPPQQPLQQYLQQQSQHVLQHQQFLQQQQQIISAIPNVSINQSSLPYFSMKQQQILAQQKQFRRQHESPIVISPPPTFVDGSTSNMTAIPISASQHNKKFQLPQKPHSLGYQQQQQPSQQPFPNINYPQKPFPIRNNGNSNNIGNNNPLNNSNNINSLQQNMLNLLSDKRLLQQQQQQQQHVIPQVIQPSQYLMAEQQHLLQKQQFLQQHLNFPQQPQQQPQQQQQHICTNCFKSARFICSACRKVSYCSRECQADSWEKGHKNECKAV